MEWKEDLLGNLIDALIDYRGKTPKKQSFGIPLITAKIIKNGSISEPTEFISEDQYHLWMTRGFPVNGDVILTTEAPLGEVAQLDFRKVALAQRVVCFRGKKNMIDNTYLKYYFLSYYGQQALRARETGTTVTGIKQSELKKVIVKYPSFLFQRKIAGILSALDSKIVNNNKINANLEAQAQALFKSWFVDFTPFKDQPFVDSELGPIPQGWKVGKYEDIILDTLAGDWGKEKITGNYTHEVACVRGCDFQDMNNGYRGNTPQRYILEKNYSTKRLLPQDLIIEISGGTLTVSTGRACLVSKEMLEKYDNNLVCTNFCKVIRPIDGYSAYCYYSWLHKYNNRVMFGYENGSSGLKNFRFKDFLTKEPLLIPPKADLIKFQHIIKLLQQKKQTNGTESTKLAALRDTLLPKLMSGEIKL